MSDKIFAEGFHFDMPRDNAPTWVRGRISVRVDDAIEFLKKHRNERGFVTIEVKESKGGKVYCELNEWKPGDASRASGFEHPETEIDVSNMPF